MTLDGIGYNTDVIKTMTFDKFYNIHKGLTPFKDLPHKDQTKAMKEVFLKLGGEIKK